MEGGVNLLFEIRSIHFLYHTSVHRGVVFCMQWHCSQHRLHCYRSKQSEKKIDLWVENIASRQRNWITHRPWKRSFCVVQVFYHCEWYVVVAKDIQLPLLMLKHNLEMHLQKGNGKKWAFSINLMQGLAIIIEKWIFMNSIGTFVWKQKHVFYPVHRETLTSSWFSGSMICNVKLSIWFPDRLSALRCRNGLNRFSGSVPISATISPVMFFITCEYKG